MIEHLITNRPQMFPPITRKMDSLQLLLLVASGAFNLPSRCRLWKIEILESLDNKKVFLFLPASTRGGQHDGWLHCWLQTTSFLQWGELPCKATSHQYPILPLQSCPHSFTFYGMIIHGLVLNQSSRRFIANRFALDPLVTLRPSRCSSTLTWFGKMLL